MRKRKWMVMALALLCIWQIFVRPVPVRAADTLYVIEDSILYESKDIASQPYGFIGRGSEITHYYGTNTDGFLKVKYGGKTGYILYQNVTKKMEEISPRSDGSIAVNKVEQLFPMRNIADFKETGSDTLSLYTLLRDPEEAYVYVGSSDDLIVYGSLFSCAYLNQAQGFSIIYAAEEGTVSVFYPAFEGTEADLGRAYDLSFDFDGETFSFQEPSFMDQMESKPAVTITRAGSTVAKATQNGRELELAQEGNSSTILLNDASEVSIEYETAEVEEETETEEEETTEETVEEVPEETAPSDLPYKCGLAASSLVLVMSIISLIKGKR